MKCENKTLNDHAHCTQSPPFITHTCGPIQHVVKCINVVHLTEIPQQSFNAPEFSKVTEFVCHTQTDKHKSFQDVSSYMYDNTHK